MATRVIAHRTCPLQAPENSLAGLRAAAEQGADGVEIDLRLSLDGQPFLFHDWTMRRTTRWPLPIELTPAFIVRRLRLQGTLEHVPTLYEALDALPEGMRLAVDVKTPWAIPWLTREVRRRGLQRRVLIWCTSAQAVRYAVRRLPDVEVAYLKTAIDSEDKRAFLAKALALGAKAVSAHWLAIDSAFVTTAHLNGLKVYSFHDAFPLSPERLGAGLDGLITDFVAEAKAALAGLAAGSKPEADEGHAPGPEPEISGTY